MRLARWLAPVASLALLALGQLAACAAVVGLEDRTLILAPDAADIDPPGADAGPPPVTVECAESQLVCDESCVSATDPANCGACGAACAPSQVCAPTGCSDTCPASTTKCDRSCVDVTSDVANCGACGAVCTAPASATPTCKASACGFECNIGFSPCASGCCADPPAPAWGLSHGCVLATDGMVKCWGDGSGGQLGNGAPLASPDTAVAVTGSNAFAAVDVGHAASCSVYTGGVVRCWGVNQSGILGDPTVASSATPLRVANVANASAVSVGTYEHGCALLSGGNVKCWGRNAEGQLGDGTKVSSPAAVSVQNVSAAKALALGQYFSCAIVASGKVKCWGDALGTGVLGGSATPVQIQNVTGAVAISADAGHACVILSGKRNVKCWGLNTAGALGVAGAPGTKPVEVPGIAGATAISTGLLHSCAIVNGRPICWGGNARGELGDGTKTDSATPVLGPNVVATGLGAGGNTTCARLTNLSVSCWGRKTATEDWPIASTIGGL